MQSETAALHEQDPGQETLAEVYDEHEVRIATYKGRDLYHDERVSLGIEGLTKVIAAKRWSIAAFETASDVMEEALRNGETVGRSIVKGLQAITEG